MKITFRDKDDAPEYPYMVGDGPFAVAFNKLQEEFVGGMKKDKYPIDWEIAKFWGAQEWRDPTIDSILKVLIEDYDKRHASRKQ